MSFTAQAFYGKISDVKPLYDEINLEKYIRASFGVAIQIKSTIADKIPVGPSVVARVFLSTKGQLYVLVSAQRGLTLGEVKKTLSRMNLLPEKLLPPHADSEYFDRIATTKFREVFPGRSIRRDEDLIFYRTLVPYDPALVQIAEIKNGVIRQYDTDAVGDWRPSLKFTYRRIRTS